jgi:hypothetical protein
MNLRSVFFLALVPMALSAQFAPDVAPLKHWSAPMYWQPTRAETQEAANSPVAAGIQNTQVSANALVFVAITPCRVLDTRTGRGFTGAFGPPSLAANTSRSFPFQTSATCSIPTIAQAYSLNVAVVPQGPLGFLRIWPTGQTQPTVSTLNDSLGVVLANAAVIAAGTPNGSVSVFVTNTTDVIIDINGYYAQPTDLNGNTVLGQGAAASNTTGAFNTAIGEAALGSNTTGGENTASGYQALGSNTSGEQNTANGYQALANNTSGFGNTANGLGALYFNTTGTFNTASGHNALEGNTTGSNNVAIGEAALFSNTTGGFNTASGQAALQANTTGSSNTASGEAALFSNTTGNNNTASGQNALATNATGNGNTASGVNALNGNLGGSNNTASGFDSLEDNTTGLQNTANGYQALQNNTTGNSNTADGDTALQNSTTGSFNIALGHAAGSNIITSSNNIDIGNLGNGADTGIVRIGTGGTHTAFFVAGVSGVTTGGSAVGVVIDSNGQLGTVSSSRRHKEDVQDMGQASGNLLRLRPVTFRYKKPYADGSKPLDYGLIAEEVAEIYPDLVVKNNDGQIETVQYQKLAPMLLNELQKLSSKSDKQEETIRQLQARLAALEAASSGKVSAAVSTGQ